jgi:hypothetical protein
MGRSATALVRPATQLGVQPMACTMLHSEQQLLLWAACH